MDLLQNKCYFISNFNKKMVFTALSGAFLCIKMQ